MIDHDVTSYGHIVKLFLDGEPYGDLTRDDILDNITLSWLTNTGVSSARLYREYRGAFFNDFRTSVPAAVSVSLKRSTKLRGVGPSAPSAISSISTSPPRAATLPPGNSRSSSWKSCARVSDHFARRTRLHRRNFDRFFQFPTNLHNLRTACSLDKRFKAYSSYPRCRNVAKSGKAPGPNWLGRGSRAKGDQERTGNPHAGAPEREGRRNERMNQSASDAGGSALDRGDADGASRRGTRPGVLKETGGGCSPRAGDKRASTDASAVAERAEGRAGTGERLGHIRPSRVDGAGERDPIRLNEGVRPAGLIPSLICATRSFKGRDRPFFCQSTA